MKKILCGILSLVMVLSVMVTAAIGVCAEETTDFVGKSSLKISYPANVQNADNAFNIVGLSDAHVDKTKDATISFYVMADSTGIATTWWYGLQIGFSINAWNAPSKDYISLFGNYNPTIIGTETRVVSKQWYRVDILVDRDGNNNAAGTYEIYVDGVKVYTLDRVDTNYSHINAMYIRPLSCGTRAATDYYFDNFLVREGLYIPTASDIYSTSNPDEIAKLSGFKGYNELDTLPTFHAENAKATRTIAYGTGVDARNIRMLGHQRSLVATSTMDLRFVGVVDDISGYKSMGLNIAATGKQAKDFYVENVWTGVQGTDEDGGTVTYSASSYGYGYVFVADLQGVPTTLGTLTFTVTPFAYDNDGHRIDFEPITVTYNGANVQ